MAKTGKDRPLSPRERVGVRDSNTLPSRARAMRHEPSDAERLLWRHLRGRRLVGAKFRRQVVIAPYIVDFVCLEAMLVVEADGGQHAERVGYDTRRSAQLARAGYQVLRFWNHEILRDPDAVLEQIRLAVLRRSRGDWCGC